MKFGGSRQVDQSDDVLFLIKLGEPYGLISACSARTTHHLCLIGASSEASV